MTATIENNGTLNINNVANTGISMLPGGLFTNRGTINIGNEGDIGYAGIYNDSGTFVNESGSIVINRTGKAGPFLSFVEIRRPSFSKERLLSIRFPVS